MNVEAIQNCTGCSCCEAVCPVHCIQMKDDPVKGLHPKIDFGSCIHCGKCFQRCPAVQEMPFFYPRKAYAVWSLRDEQRKTSASGGAAAVFYETVLERNGVGFGVRFNKSMQAEFTKIQSKEQLYAVQGSKYVQVSMNHIYGQVREALSENQEVVFVGSPCQIGGLKAYLGKDFPNLVTVDLICHGVPSNILLSEHIQFIEKTEHLKARDLVFREDNRFVFNLFASEKAYLQDGMSDPYLLGFKTGLFYTEKCYSCKYAQNKRVSDITIGDFWGLGQEIPFNHPYTGSISLLMPNTEKGENFFQSCKEKLFYEERTVEEALKGNDQLNRPAAMHPKRGVFLSSYPKNGFESAVRACLGEQLKANQKAYRKNKRRSGIRNFGKKVLRRG